jgi:diadenosine tetraphosphate (Ap4A) HIT family hydrolase
MSAPADTAIHRQVARLREGSDPTLIARMQSGWAVMGQAQFLRGYCLLLPDPVVPHLNALTGAARTAFLADAAALGDAVLAATGALRINYAMFGNLEPALHMHVVPRYADEPPQLATVHPWGYDWTAAPRFDPSRDGALLLAVRRHLEQRQ